MIARLAFALLVLLLTCSPGSASDSERLAAYFDEMSLPVPSADDMIICHGFGCRLRASFALDASDRTHLARLMSPGKASPEAERNAIGAVVAWFDRWVGPVAGTVGRTARAGLSQVNDPRQMDCVDTSHNTAGLLLVLDDLHLLAHHRVEMPVARGWLIDGRLPHATAVLTDLNSGIEWAVDPWTHAYGERPDIKPLSQWLGEGGISR